MYDYEVIDLNIFELFKPLKFFSMLKLSFLISGSLLKLAVLFFFFFFFLFAVEFF